MSLKTTSQEANPYAPLPARYMMPYGHPWVSGAAMGLVGGGLAFASAAGLLGVFGLWPTGLLVAAAVGVATVVLVTVATARSILKRHAAREIPVKHDFRHLPLRTKLQHVVLHAWMTWCMAVIYGYEEGLQDALLAFLTSTLGVCCGYLINKYMGR